MEERQTSREEDMETLKDGTRFNPAPICQSDCANATSARIRDLTVERRKPKWKDLCYGHALQVVRVYKDKVEVMAVWNQLDWDDFDD